MVKLAPIVTECIGLIKAKCQPMYLEGNTLYFEMLSRNEDGEFTTTRCRMDCSISRKSYEYVDDADWPSEPKPRQVDVNVTFLVCLIWAMEAVGVQATMGRVPTYPSIKDSCYKLIEDLTQEDIIDIINNDRMPQWLNAAERELFEDKFLALSEHAVEMGKEMAASYEANAETILNEGFEPMRELGQDLTSIITGIFNFDGDKKSLVTALKSSWNVDLHDADVVVDKFFSRKISLPQTLEELIP